MKRLTVIGAALLGAALLSGCPASMSGGAYSREQARSEQNVRMGVVESVREVRIEGTKSQIGTAAGAAVGGIAGSNVGEGKGSTVGAILGAVAGGVAGAAVEEVATRKTGIEVTIKLDSGGMTAITQEADESFQPGDRVRILSGGGVSRVTH